MRLGHSRGISLIEVMMAVAVIIAAAVSLVMAMTQAMANAIFLKEAQLAMAIVQGKTEDLQTMSYSVLLSQYAEAMGPNAGYVFRPEELPPAVAGAPPITITLQMRSADWDRPTDPDFVDLQVAACWTSRGRQIGEDRSPCNGDIDDVAEDLNGNGWLDSPVMTSLRLSRTLK